MEELDLIEQAKKGDSRALAFLLRENYPFLLNYLIKITLQPQLAKDIAQDTMVKCIEKISFNSEDQKTAEELRHGMNQIDQAFPVFTPDLQWFEQKVVEEKKKNRRRFLLELGLFWIVSLLIITIVGLVVYQKPIVFLFVQVVAFVIFAYISVGKGRKQVSE